MQTAKQFDISTLNWIKGEIDGTLKEARIALENFVEDPSDEAQLGFCVAYLHQVGGALRLVELSGAAQYAEETEHFVLALHEGKTERNEHSLETLMYAILRLPYYLESLQAGQPDNPIVLLPVLNEMRALRGVDRLNETIFFSPDLSISAPGEPAAEGAATAIAAKIRPYFNVALLNLLRDQEREKSLKTVRLIGDKLLQTAHTPMLRQWAWTLGGYADALSAQKCAVSKQGKGLLGKSEQIIKNLQATGEASLDGKQLGEMVVTFLSEIAHSDSQSERVIELKRAFHLGSLGPAPGDDMSAAMRGVDAELKKTVSGDILEELTQLKDRLDIFARGNLQNLPDLEPMTQILQRVSGTLQLIREEELSQLLDEQSAAIGHLLAGDTSADENTIMGIASGVLAVESALRDYGVVAPLEKADDMESQVSDTEATPHTQAEHQSVIRQVMKEAKNDLVRMRETLSLYLQNPQDKGTLQELPMRLHQSVGSLVLLSYKRVARILEACQQLIETEIIDATTIPDETRLDALADAVMSVEYYLDAFVQSRVHPSAVLDVAERALSGLGYEASAIDIDNIAARAAPMDMDTSDEGEMEVMPTSEVEENSVTTAPEEPMSAVESTHTDEQSALQEQTTPLGISNEIIEIFLEEANEEIASVNDLLPQWTDNPTNGEILKTLRRSFHTLKGSGRLVDATVLSDFAWEFENMLNQVVDGTISPSIVMFDILDQAREVMPELLELFKSGAKPVADYKMLQEAAAELAVPGSMKSAANASTPQSPAPPDIPKAKANTINIDPVLAKIYISESETHLQSITDFVASVRSGGSRKASESLIRALHTLTGSSRMAQISLVSDVTSTLEKYAKIVQASNHPVNSEAVDLLDELGGFINEVLAHISDNSQPLPSNADICQRSEHLCNHVAHMEESALAKPESGLATVAESGTPDGAKKKISPDEPEQGGQKNSEIAEEVSSKRADSVGAMFAAEGLTGMEEDTPSPEEIEAKPPADADPDDTEVAEAEDKFAGEELDTEETDRTDGAHTNTDELFESDMLATEMLAEEELADSKTEEIPFPDEIEVKPVATADPGLIEVTEVEDTFEGEEWGTEETDSTDDEHTDGLFESGMLVTEMLAEEDLADSETEESLLPGEIDEETTILNDPDNTELQETEETPEERIAEVASQELTNTQAEDDFSPEEIGSETITAADVDDIETGDVIEETGKLGKSVADELVSAPMQDSDTAKADSFAAATAEEVGSDTEKQDGADNMFAYDGDFLDIFLDEGGEILDASERALQEWVDNHQNKAAVAELQRHLHTLKGGARMAGITAIGDLSHAMESAFEAIVEERRSVDKTLIAAVQNALDQLAVMLEALQLRQPLPSVTALIDQINGVAPSDEPTQATHVTLQPPVELIDTADSETLINTLNAYLDSAISLTNRWQRDRTNTDHVDILKQSLQNISHDSQENDVGVVAQVTDAMSELLAGVKSGKFDTSDEMFDLFDSAYGSIRSMLEMLKQDELPTPADDLIKNLRNLLTPGRDAPTSSESIPVKPAPATPEPTEHPALKQDEEDEKTSGVGADIQDRGRGRIQHEMIRVRSDIMENLINYAGEASIYRSRIEQQIHSFDTNLHELEHVVNRVRGNLRKFDIETETQIASRTREMEEQTTDFDPLEFDRFTSMQTFSRSLLESMNDLVGIEDILRGLTRDSEILLLQQSRINTALQESLIHTRMVPLVENAPRLRRIVRQTAAELGKEANLRFVGTEVVIDRSIIERLMAPLEHMLRNAVAHGIESKAKRLAAGKPEGGTLAITQSRQGSEIVIQISDDGAGVNLQKVREKALARDLIKEHTKLSDRELMQFILESGFSTADTLSQVAGRGVGMDVVSSTLKQIGASLEIDSVINEGTTFTIRIPLTLSVSRALMVVVGEETFSVPLTSIQGIERVDTELLRQAFKSEQPVLTWVGEQYDLFYLSSAMRIPFHYPAENTAKISVLLVQSGDQRAAFVVDGLLGSREIVVKSLGSVLSSLPNLAGATILADGTVGLILDMPALIRHAVTRRHIETNAERSLDGETTVAPTVMVVDDSITVRKITERLLKRHNMEVIIAKDGVEALTLLEETVPDIMLLDIEMPRMDGFELATYIRNSDRLKDIPIIMITSRAGDKHRQYGFDIGVSAYLGKPFNETELMENINYFLSNEAPIEADGA